MQIKQGAYILTDNKNRIDMDFVISSLQTTYWATNRQREIIIDSIDNSIFISSFKDTEQIGFSRIVTDKVTFAWIADVFIDERYRREGLGKWLVQSKTDHPSIKNVLLQLLKTRDAHGLYEQSGFTRDECLTKRNN